MSRNSSVDFTKYVHEYENDKGETRYGVGAWDQESGQYTVPLDAVTARMTGCSAAFSKKITGLPGIGYKSKRDALRRARYIYGDK